LQMIRWDSLKIGCTGNADDYSSPCFAHVYKDSLVSEYRYFNRGFASSIDIVDYRGTVLKYDIRNDSTLRPSRGKYFDKPAWLRYAHEYLGAADSIALSTAESAEVLEGYYQLLGVGVTNEYGWICEYGTVGEPPAQRLATIQLVNQRRSDLLRRVLRGPNLEGRVYATDALIYLDHLARKSLVGYDSLVAAEFHRLDTLKLRPDMKAVHIKHLKDERRLIDVDLLTPSDSAAISSLRVNKELLRTCWNRGSYKIYPIRVCEVLTDSALGTITQQYEDLKQLGYFQK